MAKKDTGDPKHDQAKESLTPLMQQYQEIKARYPGTILFFRLGDFYEMFGDDAVKAAPLLEVVLTRRQSLPMCGIPHHAVNAYLRKLIKAGEKVAVCEQLEEPGQGRGIVKRGVVRVITPGTLLEDNLLEARQNNYLLALFPPENTPKTGLACVDISTGEFNAAELSPEQLKNEIARLGPREIIVPESVKGSAFLKAAQGITVSTVEDWRFSPAEAQARIFQAFKVQSLKPLGLEGREAAACACGGILAYIEKTQLASLPPLSRVRYYCLDDYLLLDATAVKNLELVEGLASGARADSLLDVLDLTLTPMGARLLRQWLLQPLLSVPAILSRQQATGFLLEEGLARRGAREKLKEITDLERILGRLANGTAGPRELVSLKNSLAALPGLREELKTSQAILPLPVSLETLKGRLNAPEEVIRLVMAAIADEPPVSLKDGGVIRAGFNAALDELRNISRDSKRLISQMEAGERARTGIPSLKIGYTSVFGYYIEVSKANQHLVPREYIRKQTVTNGERFITPELKSFEEKILSADEKILRLEDALFKSVREEILKFSAPLQDVASALAELDVFSCFAETAALYGYVRPHVDDSGELDIKDGRHPVIERKLKSGAFVSNDTRLDSGSDHFILLTGPNMAGKSTYLRQVALITVMAQMGSFVPASGARIGAADRIFTRIGAGDNLSGGESTFMVEMHETANILNQNTPRSLIILDEVGRGTSTYDGISIAWATVEYLVRLREKLGRGPRVLFATHYFELTDLEQKLPGVKNFNVSVKEWRGELVFMHKILPGAADR
ncbi:MAG: DNA mismatch repair protein MutS, partial [Endomicrobiales bacterium]